VGGRGCGTAGNQERVASSLDAARRAVLGGRFVQAYLPCELPGAPHDLIRLSKVLYFLDLRGIAALGGNRTPLACRRGCHRPLAWPFGKPVASCYVPDGIRQSAAPCVYSRSGFAHC